MSSDGIVVSPDELLRVAQACKPESLELVSKFGRRLGRLAFAGLETSEWTPQESLRAAKVAACLPSLEVVAVNGIHNEDVATRVATNFRQLSDRILYTPALTPYALRDLDEQGTAFREVKGQLSEISVLGLLWWSIAHGQRDETAYALPTTTTQDAGILRDGFNYGADIIFHPNSTAEELLIQVKTRDKGQRYHPNIAMVVIRELLQFDDEEMPYSILASLMANDGQRLVALNKRVDKAFNRREKRNREFERSKASGLVSLEQIDQASSGPILAT